MINKTGVPPIKSQGIKTKLVPWIESIVPVKFSGTWIEPFMGTGVVAFNISPQHAILCDSNPHLINFYSAIAAGEITPEVVKRYLVREGNLLLDKGEKHYYFLRDRFNAKHCPLDFLFLNRAGFNGMIRFNRKGEFNIPFCKKPRRFAQAYVTKITNQVAWACQIIKEKKLYLNAKIFVKLFPRQRHQILFTVTPLILIGMLIIIMVGMNPMKGSYLMDCLILVGNLFYPPGTIMIIEKMNTLKPCGQNTAF